MIFSTQFYHRHLLNVRHELGKDMKMIESLLFRKLTAYKGREGAILRWRCNCDPEGYSAYWNSDYGSAKKRFISHCRSVARRVLPNWWV
jgi:hypothetical protein